MLDNFWRGFNNKFRCRFSVWYLVSWNGSLALLCTMVVLVKVSQEVKVLLIVFLGCLLDLKLTIQYVKRKRRLELGQVLCEEFDVVDVFVLLGSFCIDSGQLYNFRVHLMKQMQVMDSCPEVFDLRELWLKFRSHFIDELNQFLAVGVGFGHGTFWNIFSSNWIKLELECCL